MHSVQIFFNVQIQCDFITFIPGSQPSCRPNQGKALIDCGQTQHSDLQLEIICFGCRPSFAFSNSEEALTAVAYEIHNAQ
jgi:hypothetical protein